VRATRWLAWGLLTLSLGCQPASESGSTDPARGTQKTRTTKGIEISDRSHRPRESPAARYGVAPKARLSQAEQAVIDALDPDTFEHDPALSRLVRGLARATPTRNDMPPELVDGLLSWHGIVDPPPQVLVVEIDPDPDQCWNRLSPNCNEPLAALADVARSLLATPGNWKIGVGIAQGPGGGTRMMVAAVDRAFEMQPFEVVVPNGKRLSLRGKVVSGRRDPEVHIVDTLGHWRKVPIATGDDGSLSTTIGCSGTPGVYKIEVFATGSHGPEVVANFPMYCGVKRPAEIRYTLERVGADVPPRVVEEENFKELNKAREAAGLPPLQWDENAARVARSHSADMVRNNFVGHVSPTTGDATRRLTTAKIDSAIVRENVARGYGPRSIHLSLMNSPGHRANVLAEDVTHVGIGAVYGPREGDGPNAPRPMLLTQNYFSRAGGDAPRDFVPAFRNMIDETARAKGLGTIRWDDRLSAVAQAEAEAAAKGRRGRGEAELRSAVFGLGYQSMVQHQVESASFRSLAGLDLWASTGKRYVGYGIARSKDGRRFVLIVYLAQ
jgi:uncharacterized protein YkwD